MRVSAHNILMAKFVHAMSEAEKMRRELHNRYGYSTAQLTTALTAAQLDLRSTAVLNNNFAIAALVAKRKLAARGNVS